MSDHVKRRSVLGMVAATTFAGCLGGNGSDDDYPSQVIEFITGAPAGGGTDAYLRSMAPFLEEELGVEVRPLNEPPSEQSAVEIFNTNDGYSIFLGASGESAQGAIEEGRETVYNYENWEILGCPEISSFATFVPADAEFQSWEEAVEASQDEEFAGYLTNEIVETYFDEETEINVSHTEGVEGTGEVMSEMERGTLQLATLPVASGLSFVEDGICVPILIGDEIPDPTLTSYEEAGFEDVAPRYADIGHGALGDILLNIRLIAAPPEVSDDKLKILQDAVEATLDSEELAEELAESGRPLLPLDGEETRERMVEKMDVVEQYI